VIVTSSLKPSDQCMKAARTASTVLGQIARSFHYRDRWTFIKLYKLYVRPHLEFAVPAWSPWTRADIECLEKVQKRAVGMVAGLGAAGYEERLRALNLPSLEARRAELDMVETYKIMSGISNVDPKIWFTPVVAANNGRKTRLAADPLNLKVPAARLEVRKNSFSVRVCEKWNRLPNSVKCSKNVWQFKRAYRQFTDGRTQAD
jgi:ribonucleases P/MRP protein subunit RPP40